MHNKCCHTPTYGLSSLKKGDDPHITSSWHIASFIFSVLQITFYPSWLSEQQLFSCSGLHKKEFTRIMSILFHQQTWSIVNRYGYCFSVVTPTFISREGTEVFSATLMMTAAAASSTIHKHTTCRLVNLCTGQCMHVVQSHTSCQICVCYWSLYFIFMPHTCSLLINLFSV